MNGWFLGVKESLDEFQNGIISKNIMDAFTITYVVLIMGFIFNVSHDFLTNHISVGTITIGLLIYIVSFTLLHKFKRDKNINTELVEHEYNKAIKLYKIKSVILYFYFSVTLFTLLELLIPLVQNKDINFGLYTILIYLLGSLIFSYTIYSYDKSKISKI